jgi:hypothetical protein
MALLLTTAWMRSYIGYDRLQIPVKDSQNFVLSEDGGFAWISWNKRGSDPDLWFWDNNLRHNDRVPLPELAHTISEVLLVNGYQPSQWTVHYRSIVLPLTLLSAWLILGKPGRGKSQPSKSVEHCGP